MTKPSSRRRHAARHTPPPQAPAKPPRDPRGDPWSTYHLIIAVVLVAGAFDGSKSLIDAWHAIHKLGTLQESGLAASVTLLITSGRNALVRIIDLTVRLFQ